MALYLQMDGVDDKILTPSISYNKVEMDVKLDTTPSVTNQYLIDGRPNISAGWLFNAGTNIDSFGASFSSVLVDGVTKTSGTAFLPNGTRSLIQLNLSAVGTGATTVFARNTSVEYMKGIIYSLKFYNGATLVAHYNMTTGTVQDQSGNSNHATLTGGTWLDDGVGGGTPTTQDGSAALIGTGTLTASPVIIKNGQTSITGQGLLVANADTLSNVTVIDGSANLKGYGLLTSNGTILKNGSATLQGQGILTANADTIHTPTTINGVFIALGTAFLTAEGEVIVPAKPETPVIAIDLILKLSFTTENTISFVSQVENNM